jgi:microsomal dipeptidase-like Zn-dependent dipeptidase
MEAGPLKPTLPHSNDEDVRKSLRLNIWPFLSNAESQIFRFDSLELYCGQKRGGNRGSGVTLQGVFNPSAEIVTAPIDPGVPSVIEPELAANHAATTIEHALDHIDRVARLSGVEHIGIGTDVDLDGRAKLPPEELKARQINPATTDLDRINYRKNNDPMHRSRQDF